MSDEQAIQTVVHLYVDGMVFANEAALKKAFHPQAAIAGHFNGGLEWLSRDQFIAEVVAAGSAAPGTQPVMDIQSIDITEGAASLKVVDELGGLRFTDYLSLLKIDGRWVIVNKIYHLHA